MNEELDKELQDYLKEFENTTSFDAEVCPKCGLDFTKEASMVASWQLVKADLLRNELELIGDELERNGIHYFFSESSNADNKEKLFTLKVLNNQLNEAKKILNF